MEKLRESVLLLITQAPSLASLVQGKFFLKTSGSIEALINLKNHLLYSLVLCDASNGMIRRKRAKALVV